MDARPTLPESSLGLRSQPRCEPEHTRLKRSDELWAALPFAGIFPLGGLLYELRHCMRCQSTVQRPVSLAGALELLFAALLGPGRACVSVEQSAALLQNWVAQNLPPDLGMLSVHAEKAGHAASR